MVTIEKSLTTSFLPQLKVMQFIEEAVQEQTVYVSVREVVGKNNFLERHGRKFARYLLPLLQQNRKVSVSVEGITMISQYFLAALFVWLYQRLPVGIVDNNLSFTHLKGGDHYAVEDAIEEAKRYVFHREIYEKAKQSFLRWSVEMGYANEEELTEQVDPFIEEEEEF
jgi:hypothetical protein